MTTREIHYTIGRSSLGLVLVARSDRGASDVLIGDDPDELRRCLQARHPGAMLTVDDTEPGALAARVIAGIERPGNTPPVPLDMRGTEFQRTVWRALGEIPMGSTASYTDVAIRIGLPTSARAVARACAANPLAVVVPCHRVVRSDGTLSGYRWGAERKRALLAREASA